MIGSVGGNPLAAQMQAYNAPRQGEAQQQARNDRLEAASDAKVARDSRQSEEVKEARAERSYDEGGGASRAEQRGMLLDVSA